MAYINVECKNFTGIYASINGIYKRDISKLAVVRAIVTIGAQGYGDVLGFGWRGLLHRLGMGIAVISFLEQKGDFLCLSNAFRTLDMSEKGVVSYWYGMAFAKLVTEIELRIPWLVHVDSMIASGAITLAKGSAIRGDLVGRGINDDWHVLEAKGRSNGFGAPLVQQAKNQASRISSINGQPPVTTSASITNLNVSPVYVLLDDPDAHEDGKVKWSIEDNLFFHEYYRIIINYLKENQPKVERVQKAEFYVASLPVFSSFSQVGLRIGLRADIYRDPGNAHKMIGSFEGRNTLVMGAGVNKAEEVGPDGILIISDKPDWEVAD